MAQKLEKRRHDKWRAIYTPEILWNRILHTGDTGVPQHVKIGSDVCKIPQKHTDLLGIYNNLIVPTQSRSTGKNVESCRESYF